MTEASFLRKLRLSRSGVTQGDLPFGLAHAQYNIKNYGELAEWLMAPVLKTGIPERVSGVRIPRSPPFTCFRTFKKIQTSQKSPGEHWGFRIFTSKAALWKPDAAGSISGGTFVLTWGYFP